MIDISYVFDGTLSAAGAPTGVAITATRDSTNVIDVIGTNSVGNTNATLGYGRDLGAAGGLELRLDVTQTFLTCTSLQVDFQCSQAAGSGFVSLLLSNVYPVAQLIAGTPLFRYKWPLNQLLNATAGVLGAPGRYYKLVYTVAGSNATAGAVFAYLSAENDRRQFPVYPNNYTAAVVTGEL